MPNIDKGRDVSAPERYVSFDGREYRLLFNNTTARIVEDVYDQRYGHPEKGYYDVLNELAVPKHRALMAVCYAAIKAAGGDVTWDAFEESFQLSDISGLKEALQAAVIDSLPSGEAETGEKKEAKSGGET